LLTYAGLLVVPVGAIVFTEHQIFPKIGYTRYWSKYQNYIHSTPAVASWVLGLVFGFGLNYLDVMSFYYLFIPTWFFTIILYTLLAGKYGANKSYPEAAAKEAEFNDLVDQYHQEIATETPQPIKDLTQLSKFLQVLAYLALGVTLVLALNVLFGSSDVNEYISNRELFYVYGFICTVTYFAAVCWVMQRR